MEFSIAAFDFQRVPIMGWSNPKTGEGATPFEGKSGHGQSSGEEYFFNLGESCGALCPQNCSPFRFLDVGPTVPKYHTLF